MRVHVHDKRAEFIEIFKNNVPDVLAEDGCFFYDPVVDFDSGIPFSNHGTHKNGNAN